MRCRSRSLRLALPLPLHPTLLPRAARATTSNSSSSAPLCCQPTTPLAPRLPLPRPCTPSTARRACCRCRASSRGGRSRRRLPAAAPSAPPFSLTPLRGQRSLLRPLARGRRQRRHRGARAFAPLTTTTGRRRRPPRSSSRLPRPLPRPCPAAASALPSRRQRHPLLLLHLCRSPR